MPCIAFLFANRVIYYRAHSVLRIDVFDYFEQEIKYDKL